MEEILSVKEATQMLERVGFHYTPKHASCLNMAGIEIGIMDRQCTGCRMPNKRTLRSEVAAWTDQRNQTKSTINWKFTRQAGDLKLSKHYVLCLFCYDTSMAFSQNIYRCFACKIEIFPLMHHRFLINFIYTFCYSVFKFFD
ncbi:MAG: hypothetical protein IT451_08665 [Candidatus Brocadia sp.]|nr:hypothetical protein [Candidatus Brocadia sp.]